MEEGSFGGEEEKSNGGRRPGGEGKGRFLGLGFGGWVLLVDCVAGGFGRMGEGAREDMLADVIGCVSDWKVVSDGEDVEVWR